MIKVKYIVEGKEVGEAEVDGDPVTSRSIAFFCEHCGEIWARVKVEGSPWTIRVCGCQASMVVDAAPWGHNNDFFLNSGMLSIHKVPEKVLRRELELALRDVE